MRKIIRILLAIGLLLSMVWIYKEPKEMEPWISAVLVIVSLFGTFAGTGKKNSDTASSPKEIEEVESELEEIRELEDESQITLQNLKIAFSSAKEMQYKDTMDQALAVIVTKALKIQEYQFALKVVEQGQYRDNIDAMLMEIVEKAIQSGKLQIASKASDRFEYKQGMDIAKRKIADAV